ncbi:integrase, catalytic region, zinc finger, CCHC-type containing protein [Tanacetum coccineum]
MPLNSYLNSMLGPPLLPIAIVQADRVNIQSRSIGNGDRMARSYNTQEESAESSNVQKETGNVQRALQTSSSGNDKNVQCYNCSAKGHYAQDCPKPRVRGFTKFNKKMLTTPSQKVPSYDYASSSEIIIFDNPNIEVNDGSVEHDKNAHDQHDNALELLARNAYKEAEKLKVKKMKNVVVKMSNSAQACFMLGPKPLSVYDPQLKHGLGYENPYTLKQANSANPKLYDASFLHSSKVRVNVRDTEEILKDTTKS